MRLHAPAVLHVQYSLARSPSARDVDGVHEAVSLARVCVGVPADGLHLASTHASGTLQLAARGLPHVPVNQHQLRGLQLGVERCDGPAADGAAGLEAEHGAEQRDPAGCVSSTNGCANTTSTCTNTTGCFNAACCRCC